MGDTEAVLRSERPGLAARIVVRRRPDAGFLHGVVAGSVPSRSGHETPNEDGRSYAVEGESVPRCRPYVRVAEQKGGWLAGPELRFVTRDDGMYLTVVLEEAVDQRVPGALPFEVRVTSVALTHGSSGDVLAFAPPVQTAAGDPAAGPAFRAEAEARVPADRQEQLVRDLQGPDRAKWIVTLQFDWVQQHDPTPVTVTDILSLSPNATWEGSQLTDPSGNGRDGVILPFNGNDGDIAAAIRAAASELPDVLIVAPPTSEAAMREVVSAAESGRLVILGVLAPTSMQALRAVVGRGSAGGDAATLRAGRQSELAGGGSR